MPNYRTESCAIEHPQEIKQAWCQLQEDADCSYYQSWGWIGIWLEKIALKMKPVAIKVWAGDDLIGLSVFVGGGIKRHCIIHSRAMFLNEYPLEGKNMVIEYNGVLAARGFEKVVYEETANFLLKEFKDYDEFMFSAIAEGASFDSLIKTQVNNAKFIVEQSSPSWFVDLACIPDDINGYLAGFSKNRRAQIRRSMQLYENQGALQIDEAQTIEQAQAYFDRLKVLHTHRWVSKGQPGLFANQKWEAFHRAMIQSRFDEGEIQLLKVSNGSTEIGYLYNFVWRKHIYVLQTGFDGSPDKKLMPGYVTHVLAILHNKSRGMSVYDLMHGDSLYKRMLCNRSQRLLWVVLQRQRLNFLLEKVAVDMVRGFSKFIHFKH